MTFSKTLFLGLAVVSLTACQTSRVTSPSDVLLADIKTADSAQIGTIQALSASDPTCLQFYQNTANFAALPVADISGPKPPSFGDKLLKTVVLGTLAGVASGGVAAIGIESSFAEAALIGTVSQVTYNVGDSVYDNIVGDGTPDPAVPAVPAIPALTPMQEIEKAAAALGCPAPDQAAIAALKLSDAVK